MILVVDLHPEELRDFGFLCIYALGIYTLYGK